MTRFNDRTIVVTGAAAGIGLAAVKGFSAEGGHVVAVGGGPRALGGGRVALFGFLAPRPLYSLLASADLHLVAFRWLGLSI